MNTQAPNLAQPGTGTPKPKRPPVNWLNVRYGFRHSTYVSTAWSWFLELSGKLAAPFLLGSVLYAGLKLSNPSFVSTYLTWLDVFINVAQNLALDLGGLGLLALAKTAKEAGNEGGAKLAGRIGWSMFVLMIVNLSLSSLSTAFNFQESDLGVVIGILLIARAVLAVSYGVIVHELGSHEQIDQSIVHSHDVHTRLDQFHTLLDGYRQDTNRQVDALLRKLDGLTSLTTQQHPGSTLDSIMHSVDGLVTNLSTLTEKLHTVDGRLDGVQTSQQIQLQDAIRQLRSATRSDMQTLMQEAAQTPARSSKQNRSEGRQEARSNSSSPTGRGSRPATTVDAHQTAKGEAFQRTRRPDQQPQVDGELDPQKGDGGESSQSQNEESTRKIINLSSASNKGRLLTNRIVQFMQTEDREPTLEEIIAWGCARQTAVDSRKAARELITLERQTAESASREARAAGDR